MREAQESGGLSLNIDNNCSRGLSCSLTWTVQCQSATGKITRSSKQGAQLTVSASASQSALASASSCGDNWKIDDVSWECAPTR
jgi:hypothetical protein